MMRERIYRCCCLGLFLVVGSGFLPAQEEESEQDDGWRETLSQRVQRLDQFFGTTLPGTLGRYNLELEFSPKFSDIFRREFIRYPLELRYGVTNRWEVDARWTPFSPSPFKSGDGQRWGPGEFGVGTRYDAGRLVPWFDETTLAFGVRWPLGHPPPELNDHYTHLAPSVYLARRLRGFEAVTFYMNLGYDRSYETPWRDPEPPVGVVKRHTTTVTPGWLYMPSQLGYLFQYTYQHYDEPGETRIAHAYRVGIVWNVPLTTSAKYKAPGKWQIELGYELTDEQRRDIDHSIQLRVRWRTSLKELRSWRREVFGKEGT